jgi:hypothetical protein
LHVHGKAAFTGTVLSSGGVYKITVTAVDCRTGQVVGTANGETSDRKAVTDVASDTANKIIRNLLISP